MICGEGVVGVPNRRVEAPPAHRSYPTRTMRGTVWASPGKRRSRTLHHQLGDEVVSFGHRESSRRSLVLATVACRDRPDLGICVLIGRFMDAIIVERECLICASGWTVPRQTILLRDRWIAKTPEGCPQTRGLRSRRGCYRPLGRWDSSAQLGQPNQTPAGCVKLDGQGLRGGSGGAKCRSGD